VNVAVPVVSALVGAVSAAFLAQYLRRSRPALIIDELSRSPNVTPHSTGATVNPNLVNACKENPFISRFILPANEERILEKDYISAIHGVLDQAEIAIEDLPAITEAARSLSDCLQRKDYDGFQYVFSRETFRLWPPLIGGYIRGQFKYGSSGPVPLRDGLPEASIETDEASQAVTVTPNLAMYSDVEGEFNNETQGLECSHPSWGQSIVEDKDGDFLIPVAGPINLTFLWRQNVGPAQLLRARSFAMRTAVAFASFHEPDLRDIANFLLNVERESLSMLESLQRDLWDELHEYERIVIKGFITNRGGSPVTVTNAGRLFIGLAGYSFTDDERTLKSLTGDHQVDMSIGADREDGTPAFNSSITVDAGGVSRFVATSKKRIQELEEPKVLVRALTGGERTCYLGTMVVSQGSRVLGRARSKTQFKATYTAPRPFRDSATEIEVLPQHGVFTSPASRKTI
jgi:hypothetical protein